MKKNNLLANESAVPKESHRYLLRDQSGRIRIKDALGLTISVAIICVTAPILTRMVGCSGKSSYKIVANAWEDAVDERYVERRNEAANRNILPDDRARMMAQMRWKGSQTSSPDLLVEYKPYMYQNAKKAVENLRQRGAAIYVDACLLEQLRQVVEHLRKLSASGTNGKDWAAPWQTLYDKALSYQKNRSLVAPSSVSWPAFPSEGEVSWVFEK